MGILADSKAARQANKHIDREGEKTRLELLKISTRSDHQSVDDMVMGLNPFESIENYKRFLKLQNLFHGAMKPLYEAPDLNELLPGLSERGRFAATCDDLKDLKENLPELRSRPEIPTSGAARIGWVYVCEGSTLGAAFLFKEAEKLGLNENFGARHLAAHEEGRARHWRKFVEQVNGLALSEEEEAELSAGAVKGFEFFRTLVIEDRETETKTS